jgi:hypothetical protein
MLRWSPQEEKGRKKEGEVEEERDRDVQQKYTH